MSDITTITVTPRAAADAYGAVERGGAASTSGQDFGATLQRAISGAIGDGQVADAQATAAIDGSGSITGVVTALAHAQLALQSATAIRDRVVQAYQDIMKMPI